MTINRYSASAIHLALSLLIFLSLIAVLYFWWFPGDLFFMDGGWQGIKLVAMVDLVLGPLLTLLLFKRGKPSLVFDLSVVACIQVAALAYGFYTTYQQRVVALVYADNHFNTLTNTEYLESSKVLVEKGLEPQALEQFGDEFPVHAFTRPFNKHSYGEYLESLFNDFPEIRERNDQYLDLQKHHDELSALQLTQDELRELGSLEIVQQLMEKAGRSPEQFEFYPLRARYESGLAVFDPQTRRIVDILRHEKLQKVERARESVASKPSTMEETLQEMFNGDSALRNVENQIEE